MTYSFFLLGHIRDPSNQLQVVKNLRICVNNLVTSPTTTSTSLSPAQRQLLSDVVSSCQPQESAVTNVVMAGDYELNFSGKDYRNAWLERVDKMLAIEKYNHYYYYDNPLYLAG